MAELKQETADMKSILKSIIGTVDGKQQYSGEHVIDCICWSWSICSFASDHGLQKDFDKLFENLLGVFEAEYLQVQKE